MNAPPWTHSLQDTAFGTALRESQYAFPVVETIHLVGLALSVGLIAVTDLRLVGAFLRRLPVADVLQPLRPWVLGGFAATFVSGLLLFWANAASVIVSPVFPFKLAFIALAGVNALAFEQFFGRHATRWPDPHVAPRGARLAGWASLALWSGVVVTGRLIPYLPS